MFGNDKTILSVLPHYKTDAIYRVKNLDRYDDRDDIRTNLIDSYFRLMQFCDKHLDDRFYLEGSQREYLHISSRTYANDNIIKPLIKEGVLDYTNKNNIKASNQKYITKI